MKLQMCTTGKIFVKICLKAIRDSPICGLQGRDGVRHEGKGEDSIFGGE